MSSKDQEHYATRANILISSEHKSLLQDLDILERTPYRMMFTCRNNPGKGIRSAIKLFWNRGFMGRYTKSLTTARRFLFIITRFSSSCTPDSKFNYGFRFSVLLIIKILLEFLYISLHPPVFCAPSN